MKGDRGTVPFCFDRGKRMDTTRFQDFQRGLRAKLPAAVDRILARARGRDCCLIGFLTTDDFYGCYLAWDTTGSIDQYFEWDQLETETDFLYQPLVDVVEASTDVDFCSASPQKWAFAEAFLRVLEESIRAVPDQVFEKNGFRREDVLFLSAMTDGDYVEEMMNASLGMFNSKDTLARYDL